MDRHLHHLPPPPAQDSHHQPNPKSQNNLTEPYWTASRIIALASPPASHIVCRAYRAPRARKRVHEGGRQPGAARAERVAEGDGAAVHVDLGEVGAGLLLPGQDDAGERLVDLEQVDVVERQTGACAAPSRWPG